MDKELNKKLALWAGLKLAKEPCNTGFYLFADRDGIGHEANFTVDETACFKCLVPELYKRGYYYNLLQWSNGQHKMVITDKTAIEYSVTVSDAVDKSPAMAMCLAIEKIVR